MAPKISYTKTTLTYPIVAASFDPYRGYLVVGGGGGAGRSGVGNKLTLLDVSSRNDLPTAAEIDLSRDEDAVTSVATLASKDCLVAYAGINSSDDARIADKNEHFRSFVIDYPAKATSGKAKDKEGKITFSGKSRIFAPPKSSQAKKEGYQRIIRLSRPKKSATASKRIGAIGSSLAGDENEIVVFDGTSSLPQTNDVIQRITTHKGAEPNDIDILEIGDGEFLVAYCLDQEVFLSEISYDFTKKKTREAPHDPRVIYRVPAPDVFQNPTRLKIRSLRFLSETHVLLLANLPNKSGVELLIVRIYSRHSIGTVITRKKLPRHVKAATDLDVCELNSNESGARQIAIAVAGADVSICLYTIEYSGPEQDSFKKLKHYHTLREVHPFSITKIVFQPFHSPWPSVQPTKGEKSKSPGPQYLRLASTSFGNTVVVDTFPLAPLHTKRPGSRYVLEVSTADLITGPLSILSIGVILLVSLLLFQNFIAYATGSNAIVLLPDSMQRVVAGLTPPGSLGGSRTSVESADSTTVKVLHSIRDVLPHVGLHHKDGKAIVIHAPEDASNEIAAEVHPDSEALVQEHKQAKKWEDLSKLERQKWKERLTKAGEWSVDLGETVLKGVFFSEYAGMVGNIVGEAIRGN